MHVAGGDELLVPLKPLDVPGDKTENSEEEERKASPEQHRNETACVAVIYIVRSCVPFGHVGKDGNDLPKPEKIVVLIDIVEREEYVDVVGSSSTVRAGVESEGFTFKKLWTRLLSESGGVVDTSGFLLCLFLSYLDSASAFFI